MTDTVGAYNKNAKQFATDSFKWTPHDLIQEFTAFLKPGSKILDVGCGSGRDTNELTNLGYDTTGLDASLELIAYAQKHFPKINFINADMRHIPCEDANFDGIWCHAALVHLETQDDVIQTLKEFFRVLKPGGIIHIYTKSFTDGLETEIVTSYFFKESRFFRYFKLDKLSGLLKDHGFLIIKSSEVEESSRTPNGRHGVFWVHILAKKK